MLRPTSVTFAAILIVVAGLLAHGNGLGGAFVFDDWPAIRDNPTIRSLWPLDRVLSPPANTGVGGRPLANLSFALNVAVSGMDRRGFHAGNLLLHLASALLLFGLVRRSIGFVGGQDDAGNVRWAAAATALWVVHPVTTAAVTYLSQRTELLMGFFYLLTLYAFARSFAGRTARWRTCSLAACALGMLSKEVMVTAPVMVLLYDRTFVAPTFRAIWRERRRYYLGLACTWLVLGWVLTTGLEQRSVGFGLGVSAVHYALTEGRAILQYLRLVVVPHPLVFDYGAVYSPSATAGVIVVLLLAAAVRALRRGSRAGFLAVGFFLLLAPTSSFVPVAEQPIAENRLYLPLAALVVLGAGAFGAGRRSGLAVQLSLGVAFCGLTIHRNADYRSEVSLWSDTVRKRPENPRANFNYGVALLDQGSAGESVPYFERAIRLNPDDPKAHNSLGNALLELGRPSEAVKRYAEAVRLDHRYARAWYNFGMALLQLGDSAGARERLEQALRLEPDSAETYHALGNVFFQRDEPAQAVTYYENALRLNPSLADARYNCGSAYLELGRLDAAIAQFTAAAALKPDDAEIRNNLGAALVRAGKFSEGMVQFEQALRLRPDYAEARSNLETTKAAHR